LQNFKDWFKAFLRARGMEKTNGQMLFRYRATLTEYQELKKILESSLAGLNGHPFRHESTAESALFVLYAAEWWRREYGGGAWRWTSIFESLTNGSYRVDPMDRSVIVELGLLAWGHRPSEDGKKYLGAIVAQGGLPLKLISRGDGVVSRLLLSATRKAQILGWGEEQLMGFFESHKEDLVQHVQTTEIYRLLSEMVMAVLSLRSEYRLSGIENPVAILEQMEPKWRERFPISVDDQSIDPLLVGLVREVSRQVKLEMAYPVAVTRSLTKRAESDSYTLSMSVSMPNSISVDALASVLQISPSRIPHSFVIELAGDQRVQIGQGRQIHGEQSSTVLLSGRPRRFLGSIACQEVLVTLRSVGADVVAPSSVPNGEALDESAPWVFELVDETLTLIGVGSCKIASPSAYVLVPEHFKLESVDGASLQNVGLLEDLPEPRFLYKLDGCLSIHTNDDQYIVKTGVLKGSEEQLVWKGNRLWHHSSPFPVYQGVPKLYRLDEEGQPLPVKEGDIQWVQSLRKGEPLLNLKAHRGPADAWLLVDGKRQRRFRMVLVAPDAHISFKSGETECEGELEFHGWGVTDLHAPTSLSPEVSVHETATTISLVAKGQPPANVGVTAEWMPGLPILSIDLPFPSTGGRFARSVGDVLPNASTLTLKRALDVHVQVFDQNPNAPKRYRLDLQLIGNNHGNRMRRAEIAVPLDNKGLGDLRLFEIESTLNSLFCQSDHLDACLEVKLIAGSVVIRSLKINRYDVELERDQQTLGIETSQLANVTVEQLNGITLHALPLLELNIEPRVLEQLSSCDQPVGRWSMIDLPTGHSPWLIYPNQESTLLVRPTLWSATTFDQLGTLTAMGSSTCPLAIAMSAPSPKERSRDLAKVVKSMSDDMDHESWNLVFHHYKHLRHLPLSTLDYWRVIGKSIDACLTAVAKFPSDVHELMSRMQDELGVLWDVTSEASLLKTYNAVSGSWLTQLGGGVNKEIVEKMVAELFDKIGTASETLAAQIDYMIYKKTGRRTARFEQMLPKYACSPDDLLRKLWQGEDSYLQRYLLRNHADAKVWPFSKLGEDLLAAIDEQSETVYKDFIYGLASRSLLLWTPKAIPGSHSLNVKFDVANAPLLLGFFIESCDASVWLQQEEHMSAFRQIKAFDPLWFEIGLQTGRLLAIKASERKTTARRVKSVDKLIT
jgi:hypothetical protein